MLPLQRVVAAPRRALGAQSQIHNPTLSFPQQLRAVPLTHRLCRVPAPVNTTRCLTHHRTRFPRRRWRPIHLLAECVCFQATLTSNTRTWAP